MASERPISPASQLVQQALDREDEALDAYGGVADDAAAIGKVVGLSDGDIEVELKPFLAARQKAGVGPAPTYEGFVECVNSFVSHRTATPRGEPPKRRNSSQTDMNLMSLYASSISNWRPLVQPDSP